MEKKSHRYDDNMCSKMIDYQNSNNASFSVHKTKSNRDFITAATNPTNTFHIYYTVGHQAMGSGMLALLLLENGASIPLSISATYSGSQHIYYFCKVDILTRS